jgi:sulfur carrier protein ThiS
MWQNKYIGIPFKANGRDVHGLDCWGLARLIYREQYQVELPSFSDEYHIQDDSRISELIAQYSEGWQVLEVPEPGCLVLFKVFGETTHLGVMVDHTNFIHVREGSNTVLDNLETTRWKHRVVGFYKYNEARSVVLNAIPHPLKTVRVTSLLTPGMNLEELYTKINTENNVSPELAKSVVIMVNGVVVPRVIWNTTVLNTTDVVEYRAVPGKEAIKMVALIAVVYFAPQIALQLATAAGATTATTFAAWSAAAPIAAGLTAAAVSVAGSYLINAIAPVRPPKPAEDPGSPAQQYLINGANNPYNPYGSIPVVLGKMRITPPLGAKSFATYPTETDSYLNMLLVWGYGPLTLTDFRIGEVVWDNYQFNTSLPESGRITLDRKTAVTGTQQENFDKIYGEDVNQQYSGVQMVGPEYTTTSGGGTITSTTIGNTNYNWNRLTGIEISPPQELLPEIQSYTDGGP